jgi:hypothetical protein
MTTPVSVSQGAIAAPYYPSPVQENKLPQAGAGSAPESTVHAGAKELLGLLGLNAALITDEKDKKSILDVIDETCEKTMAGFDTKLEELNEKQSQRQGAIADLQLINTKVEACLLEHGTETGEIDLSKIDVPLLESSPLYVEGKTTVKLSELIEYYREEHPELSLPPMPKTVDTLKFIKDRVHDALTITLEPASQQAYTELQRCMQERTAMLSLQSMMYHIIYDGFKKLNP